MTEQTVRLQAAIDRFNEGDSKALDDLCAAAAQRLDHMARRMLHASFPRLASLEQTADIIQEASVRLLRALSAMRGDEDKRVRTPREFLYLSARVMRRALLDLTHHHFGPEGSAAHRADAPLGGSSTSPGYTAPADSTFAPDKLAHWQEFHEHVETLPAEQREVFDLLWYDDLNQEEAAEILGISVPTVKRRWREAKLSMIDFLGDNLPGNL